MVLVAEWDMFPSHHSSQPDSLVSKGQWGLCWEAGAQAGCWGGDFPAGRTVFSGFRAEGHGTVLLDCHAICHGCLSLLSSHLLDRLSVPCLAVVTQGLSSGRADCEVTLCPGKMSPQQLIRNVTVAQDSSHNKIKVLWSYRMGAIWWGRDAENHTKTTFPLLFRPLISARCFHIWLSLGIRMASCSLPQRYNHYYSST